MRELSSRWTFFYKVVFPALWVGAFVSIVGVLFLAPDAFGGGGEAREIRWIVAGAGFLGAVFLYATLVRLKRVRFRDDVLEVSNFRRVVEIPLRDVESASASVMLNPELVWLRLRRPTEFGTRIVFMPQVRISFGWSRHPLAAELNARLSAPRG